MSSYALPSASRPAVAPATLATSRSQVDLQRPTLKSRNTSIDVANMNLAATQSNSQANVFSPLQAMDSPQDQSFHFPSPYFSGFKSKNRPRGESDLGRPSIPHSKTNGFGFPTRNVLRTKGLGLDTLKEAPASTASLSSWADELFTAFLIPTPFLLSALLKPPLQSIDHSTHSSGAELAEEVLQEVASTALPIPTRSITLVQACALTSGTLLLVGLLGQVQLSKAAKDRRKYPGRQSSEDTTSLSFAFVKNMFSRMLRLGLPFLAMVEIGGVRTGFILLAALAGGILAPEFPAHLSLPESNWRRALRTKRWTCAFFVLSLAVDLFFLKPGAEVESTVRGYIALTKSLFVLPFPIVTSLQSGAGTLTRSASFINIESAPSTPVERPSSRGSKPKVSSILIESARDVRTTIMAGGLLAIITLLLTVVFSIGLSPSSISILIYLVSITSAAALCVLTNPQSLRTPGKGGLAAGLCFTILWGSISGPLTISSTLALSALAILAYTAVRLDSPPSDLLRKLTPVTPTQHTAKHHHSDVNRPDASRFTNLLLRLFQNQSLIYGILSDADSRKIVYFMVINFAFMFIQTFYAFLSGSLGLLSDSIHMFFDCVGLLAGLIAAVMSKWPPSARFPYGYGKVETLSGLGNGIFLMIISVEIIFESFERFLEGAELNRLNELLAVSVAGLAVNMIGLFFIGHAHHGHGHGHDHHHHHAGEAESTESHFHMHAPEVQVHGSAASLILNPLEVTSHGHSSENMAGIYLHILADTMGSVAVIASTLLTSYSGWSGWDPIASGIIAILIIAASWPLVQGSASKLLLTVSSEVEYNLRNILQELSTLRGVVGYTVPRFWLDDRDSGEHGHNHGHADHDHSAHARAHERDQHEHDPHEHGPQEHDHDEHDHHEHLSSQAFAPSTLHTHAEHEHSHSYDYDEADRFDSQDDAAAKPAQSHDHAHTHLPYNNIHIHDHNLSCTGQGHEYGQYHDHEREHEHEHKSTSDQPKILGVIHVVASRLADLEDIRERCEQLFKSQNMDVVVQVDREGQGICWCGGDKPGRSPGLPSPMKTS